MNAPYDALRRRLREVAVLHSVGELLGWDQETMMPDDAAPFRAETRTLIGTLAHRQATDERLGDLIAECEARRELTSDPATAANLREIRRDYDRSRRLPEALVAEMAETDSLALDAWRRARADDDFASFLPWLRKQIDLNQRKADCYGTPEGGERYDALLDDYEPGMTSIEIERLFRPLRERAAPLIRALAEAGRRPDESPLRVRVPIDRQLDVHRRVLERIGFPPKAGRLDTSTHPFSVGLGPGDTRITTRLREDGFLDALGSTLHEAGHGLYEQGLPKREHLGEPLGEPASLGIHESQSRLWENQVGRSRAFWRWALPQVRSWTDGAFDDATPEAIYEAANVVRPHLIRVESDEATYNLHIMLRFDLERAMIRGDLRAEDLPGAWNERMRDDLGLEVPDDRRGCLQDVHWSMGAFGYFPSYTMGNLYSAQLWNALLETSPDLPERIAEGSFEPLLAWLRENVHAHGRRYPAAELCRRITGRPLESEPLARYLESKLRPIYGL